MVKINRTQLKTMSPDTVLEQVKIVQEVMKRVMKKGVHYGVIPGCGDKHALLKPGAEKLNFTFRLALSYEGERELIQMENDHREYVIKTTLTHILSGEVWGQGVGSCSTMESKYRYRQGALACPECGTIGSVIKGKPEYNNGVPNWVCWKKEKGCGASFEIEDARITGQSVEKIENPDIADMYNTVLKMAKKRSTVDATLGALAVSDIFTQDIEELNTDPPPPPATHQAQSPVGGVKDSQKPGNGKKDQNPDDVLLKKIETLIKKQDVDTGKFKSYVKNHYAKTGENTTQAELILNNYSDIKEKLLNDPGVFDLPF